MYPLSFSYNHLINLIMRTTYPSPWAHNRYNYMFHTSCKPSHISCIWQKFDKECNQCNARFERKSPKKCPVIELVSIATVTKADTNARIQKALEEKGIDPRAYKSIWRSKECFHQHTLIICLLCFSRRMERTATECSPLYHAKTQKTLSAEQYPIIIRNMNIKLPWHMDNITSNYIQRRIQQLKHELFSLL